jgi:hypothetical protein
MASILVSQSSIQLVSQEGILFFCRYLGIKCATIPDNRPNLIPCFPEQDFLAEKSFFRLQNQPYLFHVCI